MPLATAARPHAAPAAATDGPPTIMGTAAGGRRGRQRARHRPAGGMEVIRTALAPAAPAGEDLVLGPYAGSPSYVPFLEAVLARREVDLLIPTVPDELPTLAAAAPVLGASVAVAAPGAAALCHHRLLPLRYLERHRVPVPTTVPVPPA